jgi:hypothetical protein
MESTSVAQDIPRDLPVAATKGGIQGEVVTPRGYDECLWPATHEGMNKHCFVWDSKRMHDIGVEIVESALDGAAHRRAKQKLKHEATLS